MDANQRAIALSNERIKDRILYENEKQKLESSANEKRLVPVQDRFRSEILEDTTDGVYGLKTREEFAELQRSSEKRKIMAELEADEQSIAAKDKKEKKRKKKESEHRKKQEKSKQLLSFHNDDEEEDIDARVAKDPSIDTSFLRDRSREETSEREAMASKRKFLLDQQNVKLEKIQIDFDYWDGVDHRRKIVVTKGTTIGDFLRDVRKQLEPEFRALRTATPDHLVYSKDKRILPPYVTFYDLVLSGARGATQPFFDFDTKHPGDNVQIDRTSAGKVCLRGWYEQNKNSFASQWVLYDPKAEKQNVHTQ